MARVKGGVQAAKRRRSILAGTKGYRFDRSKKKRAAIDATHHAFSYAFAHRKDKKADFRTLWTARINAATRAEGMSYSVFINKMKKKGMAVDRKVLATLAKEKAPVFSRILSQVK